MIELKGPFSYSGNKYKIYKSNLKDTMSSFDRVHEPFLGSGACIYNSRKGGTGIDADQNVIALHKAIKRESLHQEMSDAFAKYFPNGRTEEGYYELRKDFNESWTKSGTTDDNAHMLHLLVQLSFNSLLRFSGKGFNVPFGRKEADLERIKNHFDAAKRMELEFIHGKYSDLDLSKVDKERDLIYFDPPYIASKFQYGGWNKEDEIGLLDYIDGLDAKGYKFILSNTFSHRGVTNQDLIDWSRKYTVKPIAKSYNAWAAAVTSVEYEENTKEVLVSNIGTI